MIEKKPFIFEDIENNEGILVVDLKGTCNQFDSNVKMTLLDIKDLHFNPFTLHGDDALLPLMTGNAFKYTMARYAHLGPSQQKCLIDAIKKAYEENGIFYKDPASWVNEPPTIKDVIKHLEPNTIEYNALEKLITLNMATSQAKTSLSDCIDGIKILDLSKVDTETQDLIVAIVLDTLYQEFSTKNRSIDHQKYIHIGEWGNDNYDHTSLAWLLDQGREYGITILME